MPLTARPPMRTLFQRANLPSEPISKLPIIAEILTSCKLRKAGFRLFSFRTGMKPFVAFLQVCVCNVCVYLSRRDVGVAKHLLDTADVSPVLDEMCSKGMAKRVRRHVSKAAFRGVFLYCQKDSLPRQRPPDTADEHILYTYAFSFSPQTYSSSSVSAARVPPAETVQGLA